MHSIVWIDGCRTVLPKLMRLQHLDSSVVSVARSVDGRTRSFQMTMVKQHCKRIIAAKRNLLNLLTVWTFILSIARKIAARKQIPKNDNEMHTVVYPAPADFRTLPPGSIKSTDILHTIQAFPKQLRSHLQLNSAFLRTRNFHLLSQSAF